MVPRSAFMILFWPQNNSIFQIQHTILGRATDLCKHPMCRHLSSCFLVWGDELLMELSMDLLYKC